MTLETVPPDGGWGWVVMVAAFVNQMLVYGVLKSGGVMYMAIMDAMDVTHTQAALVPSIAFSISCIISPLSMSLSAHFTPRRVIFAGGLLAGFGMAVAASYTSSIIFTTIFYGGVVGISCGLISIPNIVAVHAYFYKHRAFASSFAFAGGSVGCFFVPPLVEYFAKEHGIRAAFLTLSAVLLHVCPSGLLFRPIPVVTPPQQTELKSTADSDKTECVPIEMKNFKEGRETNGNSSEETVLFLEPSKTKRDLMSSNNNNNVNARTPIRPLSSGLCQRILGVVQIDVSIFFCKYFLLVTYSTMCFVVVWTGYLTLLPDYAYHECADDITKSMAAFLLSAMSVGDLIFRIVFGWVSDRGWLQRKNYYWIFLLISGSVLICYSLTQTYAILITSSVIFGVFISGVVILPPILLNDFLGPSRFPMAYAINIFINGLIMLVASPLLAYIREVTGSYKPCFLIMGGSLLSASLLWVFDEVYITIFPPSKEDEASNSLTDDRHK